jgi:hypothetical protein
MTETHWMEELQEAGRVQLIDLGGQMTDNEVGSERQRFCPSCGAEAVFGAPFCDSGPRSVLPGNTG